MKEGDKVKFTKKGVKRINRSRVDSVSVEKLKIAKGIIKAFTDKGDTVIEFDRTIFPNSSNPNNPGNKVYFNVEDHELYLRAYDRDGLRVA